MTMVENAKRVIEQAMALPKMEACLHARGVVRMYHSFPKGEFQKLLDSKEWKAFADKYGNFVLSFGDNGYRGEEQKLLKQEKEHPHNPQGGEPTKTAEELKGEEDGG